MSSRWSVLALLVGAVAGYGVTGTSVRAQSDPLPLTVGDTVTLRNVNADLQVEGSVECTVTEIRGIYVKCAPPTRLGSQFGSRPVEKWRSLRFAVEILKHQK